MSEIVAPLEAMNVDEAEYCLLKAICFFENGASFLPPSLALSRLLLLIRLECFLSRRVCKQIATSSVTVVFADSELSSKGKEIVSRGREKCIAALYDYVCGKETGKGPERHFNVTRRLSNLFLVMPSVEVPRPSLYNRDLAL